MIQPRVLYQLHWQNLDIDKHHETVFVAQASSDDYPTADEMLRYFHEIIKARREQCPEGWGPMICDETYAGFVLSPEDADTPAVVTKQEPRTP
jgi:hypothetical protein